MTKFKTAPPTDLESLRRIHADFGQQRSGKHLSNGPHPLIQGHFAYQNTHEGLAIHYGELTELNTASIANELPAGLSINLMFEGEIQFALADQQYTLGMNHPDFECSLFVLTQPEILTRHFQQGMTIKKLNIFVELSWLKKRCCTPSQVAQLNQLFNSHAQLNRLQTSPDILAVASELIQAEKQQHSGYHLIVESKAVQLLSLCLSQLPEVAPPSNKEASSLANGHDLGWQISKIIAQEPAGQATSLQAIADQLNLSISTLQRRFKASAGMTVIEYTRRERLEKAKKALIYDGLSIGEVAYLSGYQHPSNFISAFTKQYSISPSRYKKTYAPEG
ncbi:AraC family transcriptional regulator [Leucothrix mucor]|uniref:AraC family transcriptional regulator n=1 Tax=Leucothrix mucor TaxID=45248 RepID=UPI0003B6A25D|nr:helix-turn-helix domain-containing protein [Leucothrix mucor]